MRQNKIIQAVNEWLEDENAKPFEEICMITLTWPDVCFLITYLTSHIDYEGEWMIKEIFRA
jgi:hypothetical protein